MNLSIIRNFVEFTNNFYLLLEHENSQIVSYFYHPQELFQDLQKSVESVSGEQLKRILSFGFAIQEADGKISLPDFPMDSMYSLVKIMVSWHKYFLHI